MIDDCRGKEELAVCDFGAGRQALGRESVRLEAFIAATPSQSFPR